MARIDADAAERSVIRAIADHAETVRDVQVMAPDIIAAAEIVAASFAAGGQLLLCGNGGSAADAQHLAAEFTGRFLKERAPWPAIALHTNTSALTAIGNDYGFENVFARQVSAHGRAGDVLLAISTSGTSANVVRAAEVARERGMKVVGLTGPDASGLGDLCDICLRVPGAGTPRIQEGHILVGHLLCGLVEDALA
jgi:D-sedoheptulose 7-phosphate isomerase